MKLAGKVYGSKNELENVVIDVVDAFPPSPVEGQVVWHTIDKILYIYDGTNWAEVFTTSPTTSLIIGDLTATGQVELGKEVLIHDNIITLNYGEPGPGITQWDTIAGIEIDRGPGSNKVSLFYNEITSRWSLTNDGSAIVTIVTSDDISSGVYLARDGSNTPTADISWDNHRITDLADPVDIQDAVNLQYLTNTYSSNLDSIYLRVDNGNQPNHDIDWSNHKIINLDDPTNDQDAVNKRYVDLRILNHDSYHDTRFLKLDGTNSPTSNIDWNGNKITNAADPTDPQDYATKNYVDTNVGLPSGTIVAWYGDITNIPSGFTLCDGTNGTPDLRNRFIVGAGGSYTVGDTGGESQVTLTVDQIPSHTHDISPHAHVIDLYNSGGTGAIPNTGDLSNPSGDTQTSQTATLTTQPTGNGQPHNNLPPYYALVYIMKL